MPIGTFLLALALLLIVAVLIAIPLFDRKRPAVQPPNERDLLEAERQGVVRSIREIDFDHRTHKIPDDEYAVLRIEAVQRGAKVLQQLEQLPQPLTVEDEIEAQVAHLREKDRQTAD